MNFMRTHFFHRFQTKIIQIALLPQESCKDITPEECRSAIQIYYTYYMYQHIVLLMEEILHHLLHASTNSTTTTILTLNHLHLLEAGPEPNPKIFSYETCCAGMAGVAQFGGCSCVFFFLFAGSGVRVRCVFFKGKFPYFPCVCVCQVYSFFVSDFL